MGEFSPEYRAVLPDEYGDLLNFWTIVFGEGDRAYFRAFLEGDPWLMEPFCQVALQDGKIVSAVYICRPMRLNGEELYLGRIQSVGTLPEYRRLGLSTELLRKSIELMETEGFAFTALNTASHSHYARHGFYRIPLPNYLVVLETTKAFPNANPDVQALTPEQWLVEAPPVYNAFNATLPLFFERSPDYWKSYLSIRLDTMESDTLLLLLGLRRHDVLVGYLLGRLPREPHKRGYIYEVAALEPEGLSRLFAGAVRAARSIGATELFVNAPHSTFMEEAMRPFGKLQIGQSSTMHRRIHATDAMMREIDHYYERGSALWWNETDGY